MRLVYNDRQHAYWLDGRRCKGVTSVAKIPDDTWSLEQWGKRMVALGLAINAPLIQRAQAHFDERDKLDEIVEEALVAAKAHEAAARGTAVHREAERVDLGLDWIDTPETRAIRAQWAAALDSAGLEVAREYVERIVVYPDELVAGRFDRLCRRRSDGRLVFVDVKTGENAIRYPHSTVCQLALYANAPLVAGPLVRSGKNEETDQFQTMPDDIDRTVGYVVYLPAEGPGQVHRLDLTAGWDTVTRICFPTIRWRKTDGLVEQITALEFAGPAANPQRVGWLRERVAAIVDTGHGPALAGRWPAGVPTLKQGGLTSDHVDIVAQVLDKVEAELGCPFGATDPLFDTFTGADQAPVSHRDVAEQNTVTAASQARDEARHWTGRCRELLNELDTNEQEAILELLWPGTQPGLTTGRHHQFIGALIGQLADPNGAVIFTYSTTGVAIEPTCADDRIRQVCRTKTAALARAKRLARELGRPTPRTFDHVCVDPALAALVAAGLGDADLNHNQENQNP